MFSEVSKLLLFLLGRSDLQALFARGGFESVCMSFQGIDCSVVQPNGARIMTSFLKIHYSVVQPNGARLMTSFIKIAEAGKEASGTAPPEVTSIMAISALIAGDAEALRSVLRMADPVQGCLLNELVFCLPIFFPPLFLLSSNP